MFYIWVLLVSGFWVLTLITAYNLGVTTKEGRKGILEAQEDLLETQVGYIAELEADLEQLPYGDSQRALYSAWEKMPHA